MYRFNRFELAGSLGDLGVLLPMAVGMIMVNGLDPQGVFLAVGLFYVVSGWYFGVTTPVQPMKVVGSYALATGVAAPTLLGAGLCIGLLLLAIGLSGTMSFVARHVPKPALRGIQLSTGAMLMAQGVRLVVGSSRLQEHYGLAEPFLDARLAGAFPLHWLLGLGTLLLTLFLLNSKRLPAGLAVIGFGVVCGLLMGGPVDGAAMGPALPSLMPVGFPSWSNLADALVVMALPQLPLTLGNAVMANADLAKEYFGPEAKRTSPKALCVSMGLANLGSFVLGGMPMCHGAGGLAAHYRFGARTAGSNLMIGALFVLLALGLGDGVLQVARLMPLSVLGVLLFFAGLQLAQTILDVRERSDLLVCLTVFGVTMGSNLALGFVVGACMHALFKHPRLQA